MPGFNFLARLKAEESANVRAPGRLLVGGRFGQPSPSRGRSGTGAFPAVPGMPGSSQELGRTASPSTGARCSRPRKSRAGSRPPASSWLTYDLGSLGRGLPSAEDKYSFSSGLRQEDAKNLQETPMRYVDTTGGLSRLSTNDVSGALEGILDATSATYRIGVRLQGVDPKKTYSVKVATRKAGVNMLARSAFKASGPSPKAVASLGRGAARRRHGAGGRRPAGGRPDREKADPRDARVEGTRVHALPRCRQAVLEGRGADPARGASLRELGVGPSSSRA